MKFLVVHGPNLNLLGTRAPEIYGSQTLAEINDLIVKEAAALGVEVEMHHSAHEGEIIEILHSGIPEAAGALLNPGAYSHIFRTSMAVSRGGPGP
jgi:3-dehydroquinate dehydratase-2